MAPGIEGAKKSIDTGARELATASTTSSLKGLCGLFVSEVIADMGGQGCYADHSTGGRLQAT